MQRRKLSHNLTPTIIAPTNPVSLLGTGWRCIHRDVWEEKHHVFFAQNNLFCQNTIFTLGAQKSRSSRSFEASASSDFWIIESGTSTALQGRAALQVFQGNFRQGLLFLDLGSECVGFSEEIITQLITLSFVNYDLATLKVASLSQSTKNFLSFLDLTLMTSLITFTRSHLPATQMQEVYKLEHQTWFDSPQGQESSVRLSWLKKRKERERAVQLAASKPKRKASFLFSLFTLGRRSRLKKSRGTGLG
ncbi:MAG: hypothetical protein WCL28_03950 [bacterium]